MKTGLLSLITSLHLNRLCTFLITQSRAASLSSAAGLYFISLRLALPPCLPSFHLSHLFLFVDVVVILAVLFSLVAVFWRAKRVGLNQNTQRKERDFKMLVIALIYEMSSWVCGRMPFYMFCGKTNICLVLLKEKNLHVQHIVVEPRPFAELWKCKQSHSTTSVYLSCLYCFLNCRIQYGRATVWKTLKISQPLWLSYYLP